MRCDLCRAPSGIRAAGSTGTQGGPRTPKVLAVCFALTIVAGGSGCQGSYCTPGATMFTEPQIVVTNATTGADICDATVTVLTEAGAEAGAGNLGSSAASADAARCFYTGSVFGPGINTVLVSKSGFQSRTVDVNVQASVCSGNQLGLAPAPQVVTVSLNPG